MKAIKITKDNKASLESTYQMSEGSLEYSSGLYLVAGFGNTMYEGLLTTSALTEKFLITGTKLANDFFEVAKK